MLFILAFDRRQRARVFTAVPCVDGNHDIALAVGYRRQLRRGLGWRHRYLGHSGHSSGRQARCGAAFLVKQIDDQAMAILLIGGQGKALRRYRCGQVDDHAQVIRSALR